MGCHGRLEVQISVENVPRTDKTWVAAVMCAGAFTGASSGMPSELSAPAGCCAAGAAVRSAGWSRGGWLPSSAASSPSARARFVPDSGGAAASLAAWLPAIATITHLKTRHTGSRACSDKRRRSNSTCCDITSKHLN